MSNPYLPLFTGDYKRDTDHLTTEQHGAYLLLLMALWDRGGRIKNERDIIARIAGVSPRRWPKFWGVLEEFFFVEDGKIGHSRIDKEILKVRDISQKRSAARARFTKKKPKKNKEAPSTSVEQVSDTQTKGLDTPKGVNPNLPPDGALALKRLRAAAGTGAEAQEIDKLEISILGWRDNGFIVQSQFVADRFLPTLRRLDRSVTLHIKPHKPNLKLVGER